MGAEEEAQLPDGGHVLASAAAAAARGRLPAAETRSIGSIFYQTTLSITICTQRTSV